MGGGDQPQSQQQQPMIPQTGAAKYWYVDPTARKKRFDPMENFDNQGHDDLNDALNRLGLLPQGTNPSF